MAIRDALQEQATARRKGARAGEARPQSSHVYGGVPRGAARGQLEPLRHQVVDPPVAPARLPKHLLQQVLCPSCNVIPTAPLPPGVASGAVGPRLQAPFAPRIGRFPRSRRGAIEAAIAIFDPKAEISLGTQSAIEKRTSETLTPAWEEAKNAVRASAVAHADATSYGRAACPLSPAGPLHAV
jgi:hypothetical protein